MALSRTLVSALVLTAAIVAALNASAAPVVHSAYGYPAPRHSRRVAAAALIPEVSIGVIRAWLGDAGLSNMTESLDAEPANASLKLLKMLENSSTPLAALASAELVSALKTVAGLNPQVSAADVAGLLKTFIRSLNGTAYVWIGRYLVRALKGRASPSEAVGYVLALTVTRCVNASPEYLARLVVNVEAFNRYVSLGEYVRAASIVRIVAYNYSLIASVFMAEMVPQATFWRVGNAQQARASSHVAVGGAALSRRGSGGITLSDVVKAILVLRRLGPKAISILGRVPLPELVTAVKKVPVSLLRNLSVSQLVSMIRNASKSTAGQPLPPKAGLSLPGSRGGGWAASLSSRRGSSGGLPPYIMIKRRYRSLRIPKLGLWGNATLKVSLPPTAAMRVGSINVSVSKIASIVRAIIPSSNPLVRLERKAVSKAVSRIRVTAMVREAVATPPALMPGIAAALGGMAVIALAVAIVVWRERGEAARPPPPPALPRLSYRTPSILRDFWECVAYLSRVFRVRIDEYMTHREAVNALLEAGGVRAASVATLLRRLARIYEGVKFAGARPTTALTRLTKQLASEVRRGARGS